MKKSLFLFFSIIFCGLLALPLYNGIVHGFIIPLKKQELKNHYFNIDDFIQPLRYALAKEYGISLSPNQVIFGKDGFLFLGDQYNKPLSAARGFYPQMDLEIQHTTKAMNAWQDRIKQYGVDGFHIMIAPNKHSVYADKLPNWAQTTKPTLMDIFFQSMENNIFVDVRGGLEEARTWQEHPLFYKTDTHWNSLGAMYAYFELHNQLSTKHPNINWLSPDDLVLQPPVKRGGGDLASFLRVPYFQDEEPTVKIIKPTMLTSIQYELPSGKTTALNNNPNLLMPPHPLLIETPEALNDLRVLWLRDSTGTALSPYLAATFKHLVHQKYTAISNSPKKLEKMIADFQPQLILITVIERSFLKHLSTPPPSTPLLPISVSPNMPAFIKSQSN